MDDLTYLLETIMTDFTSFCNIINIPQREWHVDPAKHQITTRPFILSRKQKEFVEFIDTHQEVVVTKSRQRGYSTLLSILCLWNIMYKQDQNILYTHRTEKDAKSLWRSLRTLYDLMPKTIVMPLKFTPGTIEVYNEALNSRLTVATATEDTGRGNTYTGAIIDEISAYKTSVQTSLMAALSNACPTNKIFVSTPRQEGDLFHRLVLEAEKQGNLFVHMFWEDAEEWFGSAENAMKWRAELEKGQTKAQIARELDCRFKGAAENLIWEIPDSTYIDLTPATINTLKQTQIVSLDLGYSPDSTFVLFAAIQKGILYIYDEYEVRQHTIPQIVDTIKSRGGRNILGVCDSSSKKVDQTSGSSSHILLSKLLGCRFVTRKTDRVTMLNLAHHLIFEGKVKVSNKCFKLIEMFDNFEMRNGRIPDSKDSSGLKHAHDAFTYLLYNIHISLSTQKSVIIGRSTTRSF